MSKYKRMIEEIIEEYNEDYAKYSSEIKASGNRINSIVHKYNDKIGVINSERSEMRKEINSLYEFLKSFGTIDRNITPFDFETEDSRFVDMDKTQSKSLNMKEQHQSGWMKAVNVSMAVTVPLSIPALLIGNAFSKRKYEKEQYFEICQEVEDEKCRWEHHKKECDEKIAFYETATEIAKLFYALIVTVKDAIDKTIIPELEGIQAFLTADAIKNCIISDMDPEEAVVPGIEEYKGTLFDCHYTFVMNTFDYYTLIVKFFTEAVLTNIISDNKITEGERQAFEMKVKQIQLKTNKLTKAAAFV